MSSPATPLVPDVPPSAPPPAAPAKPSIAVNSFQWKFVVFCWQPKLMSPLSQKLCTAQRLPPPLPPDTFVAPHVRAPPFVYWRLLDTLHSPVPLASLASYAASLTARF